MIQKESQNKFEIKMGIDDLDPNDRQNVTNTDDKQTEKGLNYVTSRTTKNAPLWLLSWFFSLTLYHTVCSFCVQCKKQHFILRRVSLTATLHFTAFTAQPQGKLIALNC